MRFIAMVVMTILATMLYWIWFLMGIIALLNGHVVGVLLLAIGIWLVLKG